MIGWLDPLGWFKWPSLLLVAAPLAAFPFWLPEPEPAADCGLVAVEGLTFRAYRAADGETFILRPTGEAASPASPPKVAAAIAFDAGGMVVDADDPVLAQSSCSPGSRS